MSDWEDDFDISPGSDPVNELPSLSLQATAATEVRGIAANPNQNKDEWDDFFELGEAEDVEGLNLEKAQFPTEIGTPTSRINDKEKRESPQRRSTLLSSTPLVRKSFEVRAQLKTVMYERELSEIKFLLRCTPNPDESFGSFSLCPAELFFFAPNINDISDKRYAKAISSYFSRLDAISSELSSVSSIPSLHLLDEDISASLNELAFEDEIDDNAARVSSSELDVTEVPIFQNKSKLSSTKKSLCLLACQCQLLLANAANTFNDINLMQSSLIKACEYISQIPANENDIPLRALTYIEMGAFYNLRETHEIALEFYVKAIRSLLLDSCDQNHFHSAKCVAKSVPWTLLLISLYGTAKTMSFLGMNESHSRKREKTASTSFTNTIPSVLFAFFPFLSESSSSLELNHENTKPNKCKCSVELSNSINDIVVLGLSIIKVEIHMIEKRRKSSKLKTFESLLNYVRTDFVVLSEQFPRPFSIAKSAKSDLKLYKNESFHQSSKASDENWDEEMDFGESQTLTLIKPKLTELPKDSKEKEENFDMIDQEIKQNDEDEDEENWDVEMNIKSDVQEGAFASLIFADLLSAGVEKSVPTKAKMLENCSAHKALQIIKYPPVSQLFSLKLNHPMHEKELERVLSQIVNKCTLLSDPIHYFDHSTVKNSGTYTNAIEFHHTNSFTNGFSHNNTPLRNCFIETTKLPLMYALKMAFFGTKKKSDTVRSLSPTHKSDSTHSTKIKKSFKFISLLTTEYDLILQLLQSGQNDFAWVNACDFFDKLFDASMNDNSFVSDRKLLFEGLFELMRLLGKMWSIKKQSGWKKMIESAKRVLSEYTVLFELLEQETYCHTIMENEENIFEQWNESSFEPDPVQFFCTVVLSEDNGDHIKELARALALSDLTLFLFALSPLTYAAKHGSDDPFELVKDCCEDSRILNPVLRQTLLSTLYEKVPLCAHKAKISLALTLHSIQADNWSDAEKQSFETVFILDRTTRPGKRALMVSEFGVLALCKYGEVLIRNGKYQYGVLCIEAAVVACELRHKKDAFTLMRRVADLAAQHDDIERAISTYNTILTKYQQDQRTNEAIFVTQILSRLHLDMGNFFNAIRALNNILKKTTKTDELDSQKLKLEIQLAHIYVKSYNVDKAIEILEKYKITAIPKHQRGLFLITLGKAFIKKMWLEELFLLVRMLAESERTEHAEIWSGSRELIPNSWNLAIKFYLLSKQYRKVLFMTDLICHSIPSEHILLRGKFLLLRGKALFGIWQMAEPQHFPSTFMIKPEECGEIIQAMAHLAQKTQNGPQDEISFAKPTDILQETIESYKTAITLFAAAGDERKEAIASNELAGLIFDYLFPSVALLKRPITQLLTLPKFTTSSLVTNNNQKKNNRMLQKDEEYVISLDLIGHYLGRALDYSTDTIHVTLELETLLLFAELRYLEDEPQHATEFWKLWKDMFFRLFIVDTHPLGQRYPLDFVEFLLRNLQRGVRVLFVLEKTLVSQNCALIDTLLNVERDYHASLKRSFVVNPNDFGTQRAENARKCITNTFRLILSNPTEQIAEEIWGHLHSMKTQIRKHEGGKLSLDKLQGRNRESLRAIMDLSKQARAIIEEKAKTKEKDKSKDKNKEKNSESELETKSNKNNTEMIPMKSKAVYVIQLDQLIVYYSPTTNRIQIDQLGSLRITNTLDHSNPISIKISTIKNTSKFCVVSVSSSMTVGKFLEYLCTQFDEGIFKQKSKKASTGFFSKKFDCRITRFKSGIQEELAQLKSLLLQSNSEKENQPIPLGKGRKTNTEQWAKQLALIKPKGSLQPIPTELPLIQCFAQREVKQSSENKPLSLLLVGKPDSGGQIQCSNVIKFSKQLKDYIVTISSAVQTSELFKDDKKATNEASKELCQVFSSLSFVVDVPFAPSTANKSGEQIYEHLNTTVFLQCSHSLHIIPWELVLPTTVRVSALVPFLNLKGKPLMTSCRKQSDSVNFFTFLYDNDEEKDENVMRFYEKFSPRHSTAQLSLTRQPHYTRAITVNYGRTYLSSFIKENTQKWKRQQKKNEKVKEKERNHERDQSVDFAERNKDDDILLFDYANVTESFALSNFQGKPVLFSTYFDLLDCNDFLLYFVRTYPNCAIIFFPTARFVPLAEKLCKALQREIKRREKEREKNALTKAFSSTPLAQTLPSLVRYVSSKTSVPIVCYNFW